MGVARRGASAVLAAAAYAAIVLWYAWPLPPSLGSALPDPDLHGLTAFNRADLDLVVWILAWGAHALRHQPLALFQGNIFHPAPDSLAASENLLGLQPIAAPVFWASGNPVLTYNATVLATVWLAAFGGFLAVRSWTRSAAAGFLAGAAFALAPSVVRHFVRLHWTAAALFPLVTLLAWRSAERPRARTLVALAALTAIQLAAGVYVAFELAAWLLALSPALVHAARARHRRAPLPGGRSGAAAPLLALAAGALLASPLALPYLRVRRHGGFPDLEASLQTLAATSPDPAALLASLRDGLSWPVAALALLGVIGRRRPPRSLRLGLAGAGLLGFALACGTSLPGLYETAMRVVPGFSSIRGPTRFLILPTLAGALLAGIAAADALAWLRARRAPLGARAGIALAAAVLAMVLARAPGTPLRIARVPAPGEWDLHRWLAEHGDGGVLLELPMLRSPLDLPTLLATGRTMVGSTLHFLPLVNGYTGHPPASAALLASLAGRLPDGAAFRDLCELVALRWLAVRRDALGASRDAWDEGATELPLRIAARFGDTALYEVTERCGAKEALLRAELRGERAGRTLGDVSLAALPNAGLHGRVETTEGPPAAPGTVPLVGVTVTNESPLDWPGQTTQRDGRVALQVRWWAPGAAAPALADEPIALGRDLRPGESLRLWIAPLPPQPGLEREVGLVQEGRGWFDDLGGKASTRSPSRR